jgi:hypothetical protein
MASITTLPDFATALTLLNQTQLQRDNPALYNILKYLIDSNIQSQNTVVQTTIPAAVAAIPSVTITTGSLNLYQESGPASQYFNCATTPRQLIAGISGKIIVPVSWCLEGFKTSGTLTNGNTTWLLQTKSTTVGNQWATTGIGAPTLAFANAGTVKVFHVTPPSFTNTAITLAWAGVGLYLVSAANMSGGPLVGDVVRTSVLYYTFSTTDF